MPANIAKHPIHPMVVVFPIGLWVFSLVCDLIFLFVTHNPIWSQVAFYCIGGGIVGALLAAIPGFIDYLSLTDRRIKKIATTHMVLNLVVVALFLFNLGVRYNATADGDMFGMALSLIAIAFMSVSGWLGGALVYEHRVGVNPTREQ